MKKFKFLSALLSFCLLVSMLPFSASATGNLETVPLQPAQSEELQIITEVPFGSRCILEGCRTVEAQRPLGGTNRIVETSQSVFIFEVTTGTLVYAYNPDAKLAPGTLAKVMAALVVIENVQLNEVVTCSEGIQSKIPYGSLNVKLKSGEQLTVEDLLHCLLLHSANDAVVALAEHVSGTTDRFRALMNQKAIALGCTATEFGNISGLDNAVSYTTARDMAKIVMAGMENETFMKIFGASTYTVPATNSSEKRELVTTNYLLENKTVTKFYDNRVTGCYASFIESLGASLVCTAEAKGMKYVCVLLNATRTYHEAGWPVDSYGNFDEMVELLEYTFNNYKVAQVVYEGQALQQFSVANGECDVVGESHVNLSSVLPNDAYMKHLQLVVDTGGTLNAPISQDQKISTLAVKYRDVCLVEAELYAMNDVKTKDSAAKIQGLVTNYDTDSSGILGVIGVVCVVILGGFGAYLVFNNIRRAQIRKQRRRRRADRRRSY